MPIRTTLIEEKSRLNHLPVLLEQMLNYLSPHGGCTYIDCTFGAGGYSRAILEKANCKVIAFDQDPEVKVYADELSCTFPDRFIFFETNFLQIIEVINKHSLGQVDGLVADLGVSSMQLDRGERGFSFMNDGPLDMRMSKKGLSAADFINSADEEEIADVIYKYGDEHYSRKIAKKIVEVRKESKIDTTHKLAHIVRSIVKTRNFKIDPATKTFQAIRIYVNKELYALEALLNDAHKVLKPKGKIIVLSFHSLEDRIVKHYFKENSVKKEAASKYAKIDVSSKPGIYEILTKKSIKPTSQETINNPRARSAKLRAAIKLERYGT